MDALRMNDEAQTCPQCAQVLHDEPLVVDHALRVGLVCTDHGVVSIADPLAG